MARWRSFAMTVPLFRCCFDRHRQWLGARPAMLGDVEQHLFRAVEFLLEIAGLMALLALIDVVLGAEHYIDQGQQGHQAGYFEQKFYGPEKVLFDIAEHGW